MVYSGLTASIPVQGVADLIAKLEAAEVGSRELDALMWAAFRPERIKVTGWNKPYADDSGRTQVEFQLPPKRTRMVTGGMAYPHAEPVTTSLDAALALAERVLPEWVWEIRLDREGASVQGAPAWWNEGLVAVDQDGVDATANSPALALCGAVLKACAAGYEAEGEVTK